MAVWSDVKYSRVTQFQRLDSEYYKPENEAVIDKLLKTNKCTFFSKYIKELTDGKHGGVTYTENGVVFLRNQNIKNGYIDFTDKKFISTKESNESKRAELKPQDIVITTIGTLGEVAIVPENIEQCTINQNLVRVCVNNINPYYLAIFFLTKYGNKQIIRLASGNVQPIIVYPNLKKIFVYEPHPAKQAEVSNLFKESIDKKQRAESLYAEAQKLLELELGLDKLKFDKPLSYNAKLSEVVENNRADAEFYHIKYKPLLNLIENYNNGHLPLYKLSTEIVPNIDLRKESGFFDYIEIGDIDTSDGSYTQRRLKVNDLPANAKIKLSGGELIISQVRPTRGAISIITDELTHPTICSGAFYTCRINESTNREVIWLYIRIIKNVFEKFCGGTSYPTIDSCYLRKFPVPMFGKELAERVKTLIASSKEARDESRLLLEQAKHRVEELIEQAVNK
ncbi:MAG TPA: restriction endonuclease subunit S [Smithellaceae bacterium]|nr:restriction endonuclease subunit S [Smithellaceae bacterium]